DPRTIGGSAAGPDSTGSHRVLEVVVGVVDEVVEEVRRRRTPRLQAPQDVTDERGVALDMGGLFEQCLGTGARFERCGLALANAVENVSVAVGAQTGPRPEMVHDQRGADAALGG